MLTSLLLSLASATEPPRIIETLSGEDIARAGLIVELVERPAGISGEAFAQQLIDAEGLRPWNGHQLNFGPDHGRGSKAVFAADGRQIIVYYGPEELSQPGRVCRLRASSGGLGNARWRAIRWCSAAFGIQLPETPPPPVVTGAPRRSN